MMLRTHLLRGPVLCCIIVLCSCAPKDGAHETAKLGSFRPYSTSHGTFQFEYEGDMRGMETLWVDSSGLLEARQVDAEEITEKGFVSRKSSTIKNGPDVTVINLMGHPNGFHVKDRMLDSLYRLPQSSVPTSDQQFSTFFTALGYSPVQDTTVLGLKGKVWKQANSGNSLIEWHSIIIGKHMVGRKGSVDLVLRSVDTSSVPPPSRFVVPTEIPIQEGPPKPPGRQ